jgi:diguanylate cyclase (GGDEF)-like protein
MIASPLSHATIRTKLSLGYAAAFALVVAVGVFGVAQLYSVHTAMKEITEVWLPKVETLNKIKSAIGEHRLLTTRRIQTTNFRHLAGITRDMEAIRAAVEREAEVYARTAERGVERNVLSDFRSRWTRYQASFTTVERSLEVGEITSAFTQFEEVSLAAFNQATEQLDLLIAVARQRSNAAEARAGAAFDFAFWLTIGAGILAALAAWAASVWTSRNVSFPIIRVSEAMRRLARGDHTVAIGSVSERQDEIGVLIDSVNGYRESLVRGRKLTELAEVERERLHAAVSNMPIGLSMFDAQRRLIVCNKRYSEMYQLPPELTIPGTPLERILKERVRTGIFVGANSDKFIEDIVALAEQAEPAMQFAELRDGRSVSMMYQPMSGGGWVSTHEDVTERRRAEARIHHMARHDGLTDLPNRVLLKERIEEALKEVTRGESMVAVLCMDLDRFKAVNDTLGHPIGDALLQQVATRIRETIREVDTVARLGGDEFAVIQVGILQPQGATALASRLIEGLSAPYQIEDHQIVIGCSIGVAVAPSDGEDVDQLLKKADVALYRAKLDDRGTYRFFELGMDARMQARRSLELDLRRALVQGEFELHYQPLVDLERSEVTAFEALLRWNHPQRGRVSPADFIPLAEETGLIAAIGEWVLRQACADAATWPEHVKVAVNLSPVQFKSGALVRAVSSALTASGLAPGRLELEITETVLLQNSEATLAILHKLRELGVRVSMDDFGTGYSSLSYLRSFPFDKIKIDQSFIRDMAHNNQSLAIIQAVTSLGATLGMATTAEGVETREQLDLLKTQGCTEVQGFYFSEAKPAREVAGLLATIGRKSEIAA